MYNLKWRVTTDPDLSGFKFFVESGSLFDADNFAEANRIHPSQIDADDVHAAQDIAGILALGEWLEVELLESPSEVNAAIQEDVKFSCEVDRSDEGILNDASNPPIIRAQAAIRIKLDAERCRLGKTSSGLVREQAEERIEMLKTALCLIGG